MNQILITKTDNYIIKNNNYLKKKQNFFLIFIFSVLVIILFTFYLLYSFYSRIKEYNKTEILKSIYSVNSLYPSINSYTSIKLSNNVSIIGLIDIPKINVSYPILENNNKDLLKISVCKFSGTLPNKVGNLCIAGHNYKNNLMFSKLQNLNIGDIIYITDLNKVRLKYIIYDKLIVKQNDFRCIKSSLDTEVTLITCNGNNNSERIVIKAKVKG